MRIQKLHSNWNMKVDGVGGEIKAVVPGSVYNDLLNNHQMKDPYWRDNEEEALRLMDHDYEYSSTFAVDNTIINSDKVILRCEGLDTLAVLYLNDIWIGKTDNMHRIYEFDVKKYLNNEDNTLKITFSSPTKYIKKAYSELVTMGSEHAMKGFPQIRKAHCMFGWDWGPRLPDAGIWKDISLIGIQTARIDNVYVTQIHEEAQVQLEIKVAVESVEKDTSHTSTDDIRYSVDITSPDGIVTSYEGSPHSISLTNPKLWWPNGYGEQNLYEISVKLLDDEQVVDSWMKKIGIRTMTVRRTKDEYGESFAHEVNGISIFAMGADYIPEDNIYSRITKERTRRLLEDCVMANFNCIRVWGGGFYPHDYFFDLCDELGLVVWMDFMFACAVYELTDDFDLNIRAELKDNIRRIRHHACLGLWCGNNEMEMFVDNGTWVNTPKQKGDYIKMYEYIIPQVLKENDPNTYYWPASPSSGGSFDYPNDPDRGDVHYWEVWHGDKPFSEYRKYYFRYVSEFGFQSFPSLKTVETYTLPEDRNIFSYIMEKHQKNNSANGKIMSYMYQTFLYPTNFEVLLYASQLLQAEAIKYGVEHFRRNRGRCMGAVYWQLNDCWPVASWASIDYCGRWKALHYYAKRFFAPILLSCNEEGILTQDTNVNAEPFELKKSVQFNISNETLEAKQVVVSWAVRDSLGRIKKAYQENITIPPLSAGWLEEVMLPDINIAREYVSYELLDQDNLVITRETVIFSLPKHFHYEDPKLSYEVIDDMIIIKSEAYAKSVEILNEQEDLILSDNYFDMNGDERVIMILKGKAEGIKLRSVYDIR